ncbi:MAG: hypothetical protein ACR2JG_10645 [Geodermatophilaceae bacterium]
MTRPQSPRDSDDLRRAFREHEGRTVDVAGLLAGVRERIARRRSRRRTAGVLAAGMATALLAAVPIVVSGLDSKPRIPGPVAESPQVLEAPPAPKSDQLAADTILFTVRDLPDGYTSESQETGLGRQSRYYTTLGTNPQAQLEVQLFDVRLSGQPAPSPTGEVLQLTAPTGESRTVSVVATPPVPSQPAFGVAWQTDTGLWVLVTSNAAGALGRDEALAVAAAVDFGTSERLTFPIRVGSIPEGFALISASRQAAPAVPGALQISLRLDDRAGVVYESTAFQIYAANRAGIPEYTTPNTTVGSYQAELNEAENGRADLTIYDVAGFMINISVSPAYRDRIDEQAMRDIAANIEVVPDAASDPMAWTAAPLP